MSDWVAVSLIGAAAAFLGAAFVGAAAFAALGVDFFGAVSFFAALFFPTAFLEAATPWILVSPELFFTAMTSNPLPKRKTDRSARNRRSRAGSLVNISDDAGYERVVFLRNLDSHGKMLPRISKT